MFQNLTDIYGPIPFRQAASAKLTGISNPVYDLRKAVYAGLLADLEEANGLLGTGNETVTGDILYNGNTANWKKFANSLKLRLLMRQSKRVDPTAAMKKSLQILLHIRCLLPVQIRQRWNIWPILRPMNLRFTGQEMAERTRK